MNKKAVFEIGDIIHVRRGGWNLRLLKPEEIIDSYEYKQFKKKNPEICRLVENE